MRVTDYTEISEILKLLGHPIRLCIICGILNKNNDGCNVSYIQSCMNLPQSTVSQHLAKLRSAKIIKGHREGLKIKYEVINKDAIKIVESLGLINR